MKTSRAVLNDLEFRVGGSHGVVRTKGKEKVAAKETNKTPSRSHALKRMAEAADIEPRKDTKGRLISIESRRTRPSSPARSISSTCAVCLGTETAQSATTAKKPRPSSSRFHCNICMETKQLKERFDNKSCLHVFCASCVGQYVAAKVEQNVACIRCPEPSCKLGILEPEMCKGILPEHVFDRWGTALTELALGEGRFYCPFKDCSVLLANEGDDGDGGPITNAECPHCHRMFCAQCKVPWHGDISCEEFQKLGEDERGKDDILLRKLATRRKWQRCPQCKMYVEKIDGCMFMQCRCGYCFCYVCATPMSKETHYCTKCRR